MVFDSLAEPSLVDYCMRVILQEESGDQTTRSQTRESGSARLGRSDLLSFVCLH